MDSINPQTPQEGGAIGLVIDDSDSNIPNTNKQQQHCALSVPPESNRSDNVSININEDQVMEDKVLNNVITTSSNMEKESRGALVTCAASKSLLSLMEYGSSSSSSEDSEPDSDDTHDSKSSESSDSEWEQILENKDQNITDLKSYRDRCPSSGNTSGGDESDDDASLGAICANHPTAKKSLATEGELELDQLPPVPDLSQLTLNVKTEDCIQVGTVCSIIDRLVTVSSLPKAHAYDLDTLFFLDEGRVPLGYVYDVIGQVTSPMYVIRFNTKEEIESKGIIRGLPVFCAPNTEHTQYVFLNELLKMKGSDASWRGDNEVPQEFLDFSDDELEVGHLSNTEPHGHGRKKKRNSVEKHKVFEKTMNLRNELNSARYKMHDVIEPPVVPKKSLKFSQHPRHQQRVAYNRGFNSFAAQNFAPPSFAANSSFIPPNFAPNLVNVPPNMPMFQGPVLPYSMPFSFPPPAFGAPAIPALPHMSHLPQPPRPNYSMLPPNMSVPICKPIPQVPSVGYANRSSGPPRNPNTQRGRPNQKMSSYYSKI